MNHRTQTLLVITTFTAFSWLASFAEAQSQRSAGARTHSHRSGRQASAVSTRPAPRPRQSRRPAANPSPLRGAIGGGFGSAANVRPGFYQQLNAPRGHGGYHGHRVPIYVYPTYYPQTYYPLGVGAEDAHYAPAPEVVAVEAPAAPPQIYIVTPPVITTPPIGAAPPTAPPAPPPAPPPTGPGEIRFSVLPTDARVYLDDDYLGTGAELSALEEALLFPSGVHVLEVTHPDHRPQRLVFSAGAGNQAHVLIDLSIDKIGRRTRVK